MNRESSIFKNGVGCGEPDMGGAGVLRLATPASKGGGARSSRVEKRRQAEDGDTLPSRARRNDVQTRTSFLHQLAREQRRADRSKGPVSLVLFGVAPGAEDWGDLDRLIDCLCIGTRDTDLIGLMSDELVAVLLLDTNEQGARRFIEKITHLAKELHFSARLDSYPDALFKRLGGAISPANAEVSTVGAGASNTQAVGRALKRIVDLLGAIIGMLILSPLMLLVAIAVACSSPGPVIYRQTRLGRGGKPFVFFKFRSMYCDADESVHRAYVTGLIAESKEGRGRAIGSKPWRKLQSDPRVTPLGYFLRKTCIDELPQLFNVLKGELSLVGPRPPLPYEAAAYESWHLRRVLEATPGITGLWQVEGRNLASFDDMVRMDLRYVRTWSLMLDVKILLKTVAIVMRRNGECRVDV